MKIQIIFFDLIGFRLPYQTPFRNDFFKNLIKYIDFSGILALNWHYYLPVFYSREVPLRKISIIFQPQDLMVSSGSKIWYHNKCRTYRINKKPKNWAKVSAVWVKAHYFGAFRSLFRILVFSANPNVIPILLRKAEFNRPNFQKTEKFIRSKSS